MRVGLFTHSTNPRGGVVHALELAHALTGLGHRTTVLAPDAGAGFFRRTSATQVAIQAAPCAELPALVATRIDEIAGHVVDHPEYDFDVWHAHCAITANALARLARRGRIPGFTRTVHHLDRFADPRLQAWQRTGIEQAERVFTVSGRWQTTLGRMFGVEAPVTGNGVDLARFTPHPDETDVRLASRLGLPRGSARACPVYLVMGGIEARKNTTAILRAFLRIGVDQPGARLIVAGGASLLDHSSTRTEFLDILAASGAAGAVILAGVVDDADMPALYRLADALVTPSLAEGFGLCPLEAMACATPAIVSAITPFTEHLAPHETLWADPLDLESIEIAMREAISPATRQRLISIGPRTAARFSWRDVARQHLELYRESTLTDA